MARGGSIPLSTSQFLAMDLAARAPENLTSRPSWSTPLFSLSPESVTRCCTASTEILFTCQQSYSLWLCLIQRSQIMMGAFRILRMWCGNHHAELKPITKSTSQAPTYEGGSSFWMGASCTHKDSASQALVKKLLLQWSGGKPGLHPCFVEKANG